MKEIVVNDRTLPEAYHEAIAMLWANGEEVDCPAWDTTCVEAALTMIVKEPLTEPRISRLFPGSPYDLEKYREEMLDGILDFCIGRGWDYTYHNRMTHEHPMVMKDKSGVIYRSELDFAIDELKFDPYSRRAVIDLRNQAYDPYCYDPACLQHIQFMIRNGKLDMFVLFRSNDLFEATFMNAFALICLQERIAGEIGVEVGTYTHRANSCHVYAKDMEAFEGAYKRIDKEPLEDLVYYYKGDWDELMEQEKPRIAAFVEGLK